MEEELTQDSIMSQEYEMMKEEENKSGSDEEQVLNSTHLNNSLIDLCSDSKNNQMIVD